MAFNPDKCEVIRITKKKKTIISDYKLHAKTLQTTRNAKYLGLNISDDLSWSKHINQITVKGNNTLNFIKRNIQTFNNKKKKKKKKKKTAYKTCQTPFRILIISLGSLAEEIHPPAGNGPTQSSKVHTK